MILPTTYAAALLLTILTMICWGSWANTTKLTGKWRFELFYFDYALGVLLLAILAAYTFGSMGEDLTAFDEFLIASKRKMALGFLGGVVFNLANMLLVAAISVAGLAVAFPVGIGLALVIGVIWNYILNPQGNPFLLFGGAALVVAAIVVCSKAYRAHAAGRKAEPGQLRPKRAGRGVVLSLVSGVLMGSFYPLVEMGKTGDFALGPYSIALMFALGVFFSTFGFNLVFMNLPVEGPAISPFQYFRGTLKQHLLGLAGGAIWCIGTISNFTASSAPPQVNIGPAVSYAMGQGATLISTLWGLLVWKEFAGATTKVKRLIVAMLILFAIGLGLISVAPLFAKS
ncbi:MAG: AcrB/AcrD/AcrF family protein [Acidobacteria bacterium]|nr:AcrB/AcrD/AcrF family protein [Acidobacteriota bacterium]